VQFLYDTATGAKIEGFSGCIMADEMVRRDTSPIHASICMPACLLRLNKKPA